MSEMQSQSAVAQQPGGEQQAHASEQPEPHSAQGTLSIVTDPSPLAVSVFDHELKRVAKLVSPAQARLAPGPYFVVASRVGRPDLTEFALVRENSDRAIRLSENAPGFLASTATAVTGLLDKYIRRVPTLLPAQSVEPASVSAEKRLQFWVRFVRLTGWNSAEPVKAPSFSASASGDKTLLEITNEHQHVVFAQVCRPDMRSVNVAIPPAGALRPVRCFLVVSSSEDVLQAHVRLNTDWANAALQYTALGRYAEAERLVETASQHDSAAEGKFVQWLADRIAKPGQSGRIGHFVQHIVDRFDDPAAALVPRYVGLRTRDATVFNTLGEFVFDLVQGLSDGLIISAEIAARKNQHEQAASCLLTIPAGGLPLFSDGFSLLLHRVKELIDLDPEGLPDTAIPTPTQLDGLKNLLRTLLKWAPFVNINSPTLTFRSNDITAPKENENPRSPNVSEGWSLVPGDSG